MNNYYQEIFKRKSFHFFNGGEKTTEEDINKLIDIEPDGWLKVFFTNNPCHFE